MSRIDTLVDSKLDEIVKKATGPTKELAEGLYAFREHGKLRHSLTEDVPGAAKHMEDLAKAGISMKEVTDKLLADGVRLFAEAFKTLLEATGKSAGAH